jgi:tripartite-type tricarboxylate transporter receptor subunit TctC
MIPSRALRCLIAFGWFVPFADTIAQGYPAKPVRVIAPFAPGGAADVVSRTVSERLTAALGQQFVVDNRAGAAGTIGLDMLSRAASDGYTIGAASEAMTVLAYTQKGVAWNPLASFTPIGLMSTQPLVLAVNAAVPATSIRELIAYSKAKPGQLSFGSSGHGHPQHLTGELIRKAAGIDMVHVPYKGGGQAVIDLVGGQIPAAVLGSSPVIPHHRTGKVRILAVTSAKRSPTLPNVPTLAESGVAGIDVSQTIGMFGPAKLPREIVARLHAEIATALASPAVRERLENAGFEATPSTPQQLADLMRAHTERWGRLIKELDLRF